MKKIIPFLLTLAVLANLNICFGQNNSSPIVAVFNGDQASLDKEIASKTISFTLKKLDENSRSNFETQIKVYSSAFTVYYPNERESKTSQVYVLTLLGDTRIEYVNRFFAASHINAIEFNGKAMTRNDFFKRYIN